MSKVTVKVLVVVAEETPPRVIMWIAVNRTSRET